MSFENLADDRYVQAVKDNAARVKDALTRAGIVCRSSDTVRLYASDTRNPHKTAWAASIREAAIRMDRGVAEVRRARGSGIDGADGKRRRD